MNTEENFKLLSDALKDYDADRVLDILSVYFEKEDITNKTLDYKSYYSWMQGVNLPTILDSYFKFLRNENKNNLDPDQFKILFDVVYDNLNIKESPGILLSSMDIILKYCLYASFYKNTQSNKDKLIYNINYFIEKIEYMVSDGVEQIASARSNNKQLPKKALINETQDLLYNFLHSSFQTAIYIQNIDFIDKIAKLINTSQRGVDFAYGALILKKDKSFVKLLEYINPKWQNSTLLYEAVSHYDYDILKVLIPLSNPRKNNSIAISQVLFKSRKVDDVSRKKIFDLLLPHSHLHDALLHHVNFQNKKLDIDLFIDHVNDKLLKKIIKKYPKCVEIPQIQKRVINMELEKYVKIENKIKKNKLKKQRKI